MPSRYYQQLILLVSQNSDPEKSSRDGTFSSFLQIADIFLPIASDQYFEWLY